MSSEVNPKRGLGIEENLDPETGYVDVAVIAGEYVERRERGASLDSVRGAYEALKEAVEYNNRRLNEKITD
jgi:hypothetical protein